MADHIWVVRLPDRRVAGAGLDTYSATQEAHRHGISQWVLDGLMYDAENGAHTSNNGYTLTREPLSATVAVNAETFTAWLCEQMPQGTVIGDPKWWAPKILHAVRAFTEVPAPVAASEPVAEHVAWLRYVDWPNGQTSIRVCDSDDEGAFKVYTHPPTAAVTVTEACSECNGTGSVVVPVCCGSGYGSECCGCPDPEDAPCPKCAPHPSAAGVVLTQAQQDAIEWAEGDRIFDRVCEALKLDPNDGDCDSSDHADFIIEAVRQHMRRLADAPPSAAGVTVTEADAAIVAAAERWERADESGNGFAYVVFLKELREAVIAKRTAAREVQP